jgi:hypothetical protein
MLCKIHRGELPKITALGLGASPSVTIVILSLLSGPLFTTTTTTKVFNSKYSGPLFISKKNYKYIILLID